MGYLGIKPANSPLTSELIPDGIISTSDIADGAITTAKIGNGAVVPADLSSDVYVAKAWVNFNGTGTVAIRASGNVSSITDNGVGDYTITFTNAMADADYATIMTSRFGSADSNGVSVQAPRSGSTYSTTAVRVLVTNALGSSAGMWDADAVYAAIFR